MSDVSDDNLHTVTVEILRQYLARDVWQAFFQRERQLQLLDIVAPSAYRWRVMLNYSLTVGTEPTLLVPDEPLAEEISSWIYSHDRPQGFTVEHVANRQSGGDAGYVGTIDGMHVYQLNGLADRAILCSGRCLRSVTYQMLSDRHDLVDVTLEENENPVRSRLRLRTAQVLDWSNDPIIEFSWPAVPNLEP